ncbi:MAG: segregation/condensation protein A [Candidatus Andersenbacteria bacterium]|nr:segregation/condensation protein A [bacterium]MDZ4225797.1 segregation/condensation protein A [Candidatus Andersenbacteria bacterium]
MVNSALPTIRIENFEGPFDLLLELARVKKIDLARVSLMNVTNDFLAYIDSNRISPALQADWLVVAATLLLLKLKQVLPDLTEEEEEEIAELSDRLKIYQLYRTQAEWQRERWNKHCLLPGPEKLKWLQNMEWPDMSANQLQQIYMALVARIKLPPEPVRHLRRRGRTLNECLRLLGERLKRLGKFTFTEVVDRQGRDTAAVSLLAILEMARTEQIDLSQDDLFGEIIIEARG